MYIIPVEGLQTLSIPIYTNDHRGMFTLQTSNSITMNISTQRRGSGREQGGKVVGRRDPLPLSLLTGFHTSIPTIPTIGDKFPNVYWKYVIRDDLMMMI